MDDTFYFGGITEETINQSKFICIRILDYEKFMPIKIYKKYTEDLKAKIFSRFDLFEDITSSMTYVIKQDQKTNKLKVVFDIKI